MTKNYTLYLLWIFLGLGTLVGLALPYLLHFFTEVPGENLLALQLLALGAGWFLGAVNFGFHYFFNRYVIGRFREVLARVREEDYSARVKFSSNDMLGLLADDVNDTLSHLEEKNEEVQQDDLTKLPNRHFLKQYYRKNVSKLTHQKTAFLFFDLDKFKAINDQFGHLYGDRVLVEVANRVRSALTEDEFLIRLSGDEFLIVAPLSEDCKEKDIAEQLMALFTQPFDIYGTLIHIQTSIGVSTAPAHGDNLAELVRKSDFAMYEAKKTEGVTYYIFEEKEEPMLFESAQPIKAG